MDGEIRIVTDVAGAFAQVVLDARPASLAVSGGDTAEAAYARLAEAGPLDWLTDAWIGDERWVEVDDADSNEGMARRVLLDRVGATVHSARGAGATPAEAAEAYDGMLRATGGLDLVHLGLGPDGHTASLFPGSPSLDEAVRWVVVTGDDAHPHRRLTMTLPAIAAARLVVVTVDGDSKREAFARVRASEDLPAARVRAERVLWLVDPAAAG